MIHTNNQIIRSLKLSSQTTFISLASYKQLKSIEVVILSQCVNVHNDIELEQVHNDSSCMQGFEWPDQLFLNHI